MDKIIQQAWDHDEASKLAVGTTVRIDMSWHMFAYGNIPDNSGHGLTGKVKDAWKDVDGFYLYDLETENGMYGAYSRKDLVDVT